MSFADRLKDLKPMSIQDYYTSRSENASNPYQGEYKKVLCVCSAGLLRSPTTALVLSQKPFNYNTRAAGLEPTYALIPVDAVLLDWADEIVCMNADQKIAIEFMGYSKPIHILDIPDKYEYRHPNLIKIIKSKCKKLWKVPG